MKSSEIDIVRDDAMGHRSPPSKNDMKEYHKEIGIREPAFDLNYADNVAKNLFAAAKKHEFENAPHHLFNRYSSIYLGKPPAKKPLYEPKQLDNSELPKIYPAYVVKKVKKDNNDDKSRKKLRKSLGGNKNRTKRESPPKLEIRIDRYTSESKEDSTEATQRASGFTKRDGPRTILRKVNQINEEQKTRRQRGVSNNPFKRGNEHIFSEERAMMLHERRGGRKYKTRRQHRRL